MSNNNFPFDTFLVASLECLQSRLAEANALVGEAQDLAKNGNRNAAVGTLLSMTTPLADSHSLLDTLIVLHRSSHPAL